MAPGLNIAGLTITMPTGRSGLKRRPIVIRPQNGQDTATLNNNLIVVNGRWIVFDGFAVIGANSFDAAGSSRYCRITRMSGTPAGRHWSKMAGMFWRTDHCDLSGKTGTARVIQTTNGYYGITDHCYFHDNPDLGGINGPEAWANGSGGADRAKFTCEVFYRNFLFRSVSESEITSVKSSGALLIGNTVDQCNIAGGSNYGSRSGRQAWFESEWWEDVGTFSQNAGVRLLDSDNVMIGCHVVNCRASVRGGDIAADDLVGIPVPFPYASCDNNLIIGCTEGTGGQLIVGYFGTASHTIPAINTDIDQSPGVTVDSAKALNTTINPTARIPFTAAVKLTTAAVGTDADDPLVPPGFR